MRRVFVRLAFGLILFYLMLIFAAFAVAHAQPPRSWITWTMGDYGERMDIYLWDGSTVLNFTRNFPSLRNTAPAWSYDGQLAWIANLDGDDDVFVWDGERIRDVSQSDENESRLLWSPTGQLAWVTSDGAHTYLRIWEQGGGITLSMPVENSSISMVWSNDGLLAWATPDGEVLVWNGEIIIDVSSTHQGSHYQLVWSPDGRLAWRRNFYNSINEQDTELLVWDRSTTRMIASSVVNFSVWSAEGHLRWVGHTSDLSYEVYLWNNGEYVTLFSNSDQMSGLQWSPDGSRLAWLGIQDYRVQNLYMWDGAEILTERIEDGIWSDLIWIDNERLIVQAFRPVRPGLEDSSTDLILWDGESVTRLTDDENDEWSVRVLPNGSVAWITGETFTALAHAFVIWNEGDYSYYRGTAYKMISYEFTFSPAFP